MKVFFYSSGKVFSTIQTGGVKRFVELLKASCSIKSIDTLFASPDEEKEVSSLLNCDFIQLKVNCSRGIFSIFPPELFKLMVNRNLLKRLRKKKSDLTVVFDVPPAIGLVILGFKNIVLMIRKDLIGYEKTINRKWTLYPKLFFLWICESICMIRSKTIVCQCEYDKCQLKRRHKLIANIIEVKTKILINNVNPSWIAANTCNTTDNCSLGEKSRFRVCFIGNFDTPRKGHQLLIDTAIEILKDENDIEFVLVGGGESLEKYRSQYSNDYIRFVGKLSNPISILKQSDLLVVPSYADSCPNTVMEALYNEVPVVGSKAGGIPEILLAEEALFELNINSLKSSILKYKSSPIDLEHLCKLQKDRKTQLMFNWGEEMMKTILS